VAVAVAAGVPVHGCYQSVQCLIAVGCVKRSCDLRFWEKLSVLVTAFYEPVGVEQEPVAGRPGSSERGEVILKAKRQGGLPVGQRLQVAAVAQQRRVMAAVNHGELAAMGDLH
jgi:hypothetical protein